MSKIVSIGTATPLHKHKQQDIFKFMQHVYAMDAVDTRKLKFLYHHSAIDTRYSVVSDYSRDMPEWRFYPHAESLEPFPSLELRMLWYNKYAAPLSVDAIRDCMEGKIAASQITHLITVSCTGMSAPGLDLQVMELMDISRNIFRTSMNFMGCYAALHALKLADNICKLDIHAKVMIVCTELCTLHFQKQATADNIAASLLFADGSAAALITHDDDSRSGIAIKNFYAEVLPAGKKDMSWELSSTGFLMTLSGYVPDLIKEDFNKLLQTAIKHFGIKENDIKHWCIHPGGKRILEAIEKSVELQPQQLQCSYDVLKDYGNMSSATILFVLKEMMKEKTALNKGENIFGAAFGPGLTMETMLLQV